MVHIADAKFYKSVMDRLQICDVIMEEGVKAKSTKLITSAYRYIAKNPRLNLTIQTAVKPENFKAEIIYPDVSGEAFDKKVNKIPLRYRLMIYILSPLYGSYMRFFGTRKKIISNHNIEMLESRKNLLIDDEFLEQFDDIVLTWRDKALIKALDKQIHSPAATNKKIGIIYGAEHIRAVLKFLMLKRDFKVINSEWLTVIEA